MDRGAAVSGELHSHPGFPGCFSPPVLASDGGQERNVYGAIGRGAITAVSRGGGGSADPAGEDISGAVGGRR
jgi:hypothetical protein